MKVLNPKEFRELGYLQEVNRLVLHPLGLALYVNTEDPDNNIPETFGGVMDHRDDKEGMIFDKGVMDEAKVLRVRQLLKEVSDQRLAALGYLIQPSQGEETYSTQSPFPFTIQFPASLKTEVLALVKAFNEALLRLI
jgi:hypothetical protein